MRTFKTKPLGRFTRRERITGRSLSERDNISADELERWRAIGAARLAASDG